MSSSEDEIEKRCRAECEIAAAEAADEDLGWKVAEATRLQLDLASVDDDALREHQDYLDHIASQEADNLRVEEMFNDCIATPWGMMDADLWNQAQMGIEAFE